MTLACEPKLDDSGLAAVLEELELLVPHPDIGGLIFSQSPELSVEDVVELALAYVPLVLPRFTDE